MANLVALALALLASGVIASVVKKGESELCGELKSLGQKIAPECVHPSDAQQGWAAHTRQELLSSLSHPQLVKDGVSSVIKASERSKNSSEYGSLMVQIGERVLSAVNENGSQLITSNNPRTIEAGEWNQAAASLTRELQYAPITDKSEPITLYQMHSHPNRKVTEGAMTKPPIYTSQTGVPYTHTNSDDIASADQMLSHMTRQLRALGYTGPIKIVSIIAPANIGDQERYVVVYSK